MEFPQSVKGTRDIFGSQAHLYHFIVEQAIRTSKRFGFEYIELPILEHLNLFIRSIGQDTDVVSKELFSWRDKADRDLCLRPEGTAQTVRFLLEQGQLREPLKRYIYAGSMFRAEKPQKGRQREFHQIGIEIFGEAEPLADVETIHFAMMFLDCLQIPSPRLWINSVGCEQCRPLYVKKLREYFELYKEELCRTCQIRLEKNPLRILDCKQEACQKIIIQAPSILEYLCEECHTHFEFVKEGLGLLSIPFIVQPRLVRGLDYYTRTAFEITLPELLGSQDAVCGGGRYDNLVKLLSEKEDVPAVGLALGVERLMIALDGLKNPIPKGTRKIDIVVITEKHLFPKIFAIVNSLREKEFAIHFDIQERGISKKIARADKLGAKWLIILGDREVEQDLFTLKNLKTTKQQTVNWQELQDILQA